MHSGVIRRFVFSAMSTWRLCSPLQVASWRCARYLIACTGCADKVGRTPQRSSFAKEPCLRKTPDILVPLRGTTVP
jgi:hypothetical protein